MMISYDNYSYIEAMVGIQAYMQHLEQEKQCGGITVNSCLLCPDLAVRTPIGDSPHITGMLTATGCRQMDFIAAVIIDMSDVRLTLYALIL